MQQKTLRLPRQSFPLSIRESHTPIFLHHISLTGIYQHWSCRRVTVLGAAGGIGQPLSPLLKLNPRVSELALHDVRLALGVAAYVDYINTKSTVKSYDPTNAGLKDALSSTENRNHSCWCPAASGKNRAPPGSHTRHANLYGYFPPQI
ncbi:hypothetical protein EJ06DRAFT_264201 [Trichodelitschia bisporula]|uniref:malate dehydrogenase n=1 Tax=Trichodelitschia bisporula TaxID=703511 RepID=A0A6G1HIG5_9PEZI|nr:hypothetical protein EJ06DRAFT_264201 [Trichodelitschia bisporula]